MVPAGIGIHRSWRLFSLGSVLQECTLPGGLVTLQAEFAMMAAQLAAIRKLRKK